MDELVMTIKHDNGGSHSWWVGEGIWWLMVEGFGLVKTYKPLETWDF
jgi:hypothetical protein